MKSHLRMSCKLHTVYCLLVIFDTILNLWSVANKIYKSLKIFEYHKMFSFSCSLNSFFSSKLSLLLSSFISSSILAMETFDVLDNRVGDEFGNAKDNKEHFEYIYSYAPYNNIKKMDYPHMFITTSLSDNRVLFDEPLKFTAKLREYKTDNNLLLLKTEMNAGHGGKSGRDGAIEEIALDYAFALKVSKKI